MSELQIIEVALQKAARRQRWQSAWRGFWQGLAIGSVLWLIALIAYKLLPIPVTTLDVGGAVFLLCILAGFLRGWARRPSLSETARWVDVQQQLKERLSTALEISQKPVAGHWKELLMADAAACAGKLDAKRMLPFHLPAAGRWALLTLALAAGLGFAPEYRSQKHLQAKRDEEVIKHVGKQLSEIAKRDLKQRPPALETTEKSMKEVVELGDMLQKANLSRTDALKDLANVTDKLKDQLKEIGKDPAIQRMEKAARTTGGETAQTPAALQQKMDELSKALGEKAAAADKLEQMRRELQKMKEAAAGLPSDNTAASQAAREQLSQSLSSLSQQAQAAGVDLPSLQEAIEALANAKPELVMKDLNIALQDLQKMADMAKSLQQLKAQAAKLGKDLGEQLKNGQVEAAQATLNKMTEQLQAAGVSQEQLQKMLEEVSKAVDPASEYGKVAELLKNAAQQMKGNQRPEASKSLADAANELKKMMEQLSDAQSLMSSLDALRKAEMCLATGQCNNFSNTGSPKAGPGGKPGRGVGTWADEMNGWAEIPEFNDAWDNSGLVRPDLDPRGHTDRGEGQPGDNLTPTKVKGQFSPGGQMPSITLKGVSIKGQSNVKFEEAAAAAQADAQSALSQEKVPRAYQGAVRDYFDDLKK